MEDNVPDRVGRNIRVGDFIHFYSGEWFVAVPDSYEGLWGYWRWKACPAPDLFELWVNEVRNGKSV